LIALLSDTFKIFFVLSSYESETTDAWVARLVDEPRSCFGL